MRLKDLPIKKSVVSLFALFGMAVGSSAQDMTATPLTLEAIEDGTTITITNPQALTIQYSTDGGTSWISSSSKPITISGVNAGATVQFRGNNTAYSDGTVANSTIINCDKDCYGYGNVMSLVSAEAFSSNLALTANNAFYDLFDSNTHLKNHETKDLVLPATTLTEGCYTYMFYKCSALTKAPALPATTLAKACYKSMFSNCTALVQACELPATTLKENCYENMFRGCSALTVAPVLPATTLADYCYSFMFYACSVLETAPALPATKMEPYCYGNMFGFCHALTATPALPATTLAENCYYRMFLGCKTLTTITSLPATTLSPYCYNEMFRQCPALTTGPSLPATTLADYCYRCMFQACTALTTPSALPATTLAQGCYLGMFVNTGLTAGPALPATTLAKSCYYQMFQNNPNLESSPALPATTLAEYCYLKMFADCPKLATVGDLSATTAAESCCEQMFWNCTSLETAPSLPATTLAPTCYNYMFQGCTGLKNAPVLPATTLATQCYQRMFEGCTSLVTAPELPATNLADLCYNDMFWECTALKDAPVLPATTLVDYCYTMMFYGCTSLEKAPDLLVATLPTGCYEHMFAGCTSLNYVKCLATDISAPECIWGWLDGVSATGTFVMKSKMVDYPSSDSGIPAGWTKVGADTEIITANSDGEATPTYWATFYRENVPCQADANTTVYTAKVSADESKLELTEVGDKIIPAGNAVILKSTAANIMMTYDGSASGTLSNNDLKGASTAISTPDNTYMLVKGGNGVGFYHWTGEMIPDHRAYLVLTSSSSSRSFFGIGDGENGTTSIDGVTVDGDEAQLYDLTGRIVNGQPRPGIYVRNGKKLMIK